MRQFEEQDSKSVMERLRGSLMMLSFGLVVLGYLVAIDRPEWFSVRPASGTAAAMANASTTAAKPLAEKP